MSKVLKLIAMGTLVLTGASAGSTAVCKGCHGQNWEKAAMGKAKVVKDMSKKEIIQALQGYKDGSYGGPMKGLMKVQVAKLSSEEIRKMAADIKK